LNGSDDMLKMWTDISGQNTGDGIETFCGLTMSEGNYAEKIPENKQEECKEYLSVLEVDENIDIQKLKKIRLKMLELLEEAEYLVKKNSGNGLIYERAKSYWIPHIKMSLQNETEYLGKSMISFEDTIIEIEKKLNLEKDEEGEDK
jgi:hypothetical protein